jgi:Na+/H+-translocating membrane pyrophosphatase
MRRLFGTIVATMGMLNTVGYVLIMDMFGPIAECKFVEMNQQVWIHISQ